MGAISGIQVRTKLPGHEDAGDAKIIKREMKHERDRKVDTFGFGVDQHEDQKRGFALAEIDR
jgi:hypothetical protein